MVAEAKSVRCVTCGVVCTGRFSGCAAVWAAGPRKVKAVRGAVPQRRSAPCRRRSTMHLRLARLSGPRTTRSSRPCGAELESVMRRLDDAQVDAVRADLASVARELQDPLHVRRRRPAPGAAAVGRASGPAGAAAPRPDAAGNRRPTAASDSAPAQSSRAGPQPRAFRSGPPDRGAGRRPAHVGHPGPGRAGARRPRRPARPGLAAARRTRPAPPRPP